ncbi:protein of unknown function [Modestobacter italicus]|uniref:Uncharacterized protein n=1 Tax=Modestobacter italicus (strain DSM 44449 / CECT 9708 / BC 501) TaxID=2732864 RepID=I4EXH4_MODI5|nr:protein of unknown function [Modestobacter marinus]
MAVGDLGEGSGGPGAEPVRGAGPGRGWRSHASAGAPYTGPAQSADTTVIPNSQLKHPPAVPDHPQPARSAEDRPPGGRRRQKARHPRPPGGGERPSTSVPASSRGSDRVRAWESGTSPAVPGQTYRDGADLPMKGVVSVRTINRYP